MRAFSQATFTGGVEGTMRQGEMPASHTSQTKYLYIMFHLPGEKTVFSPLAPLFPAAAKMSESVLVAMNISNSVSCHHNQ